MPFNGEVEKARVLESGGPEFSPSPGMGKLCNLFELQFSNLSNGDNNNPY